MRLFIALLSVLVVNLSNAQNKEVYLLVGSNTTDGISVYKFNTVLGTSTFVSKLSDAENTTYMAFSRDHKYIYGVNEYSGNKTGDVSAYSFDKTKGELHFLNKTTTAGIGPCYVDIDSTGKWVVVANYGGGNLSMIPVGTDGSLQPLVQTIQHQGYGANATRQNGPHAHCATFSSDGKYVFSNDLGTDVVYQYKFTPSSQQPLSETDTALMQVPDGFGPRHITFHPNGKFAYLINELSGKVIAYQYNSSNGRLTELQTIESTNIGEKQDKGSADIHITPNGQYLYTTNRGSANDITIYRVGSTGLLTVLGHQSCGGIHPRNFTIDPTGKFLLVANRDSNNIVVYTIIKSTGMLEAAGQPIQVTKPMFVRMIEK